MTPSKERVQQKHSTYNVTRRWEGGGGGVCDYVPGAYTLFVDEETVAPHLEGAK